LRDGESDTGGNSTGTRQSGHVVKPKDAMSQLSDLSLPSEQIRAAKEVRASLTRLHAAVEGRFTKYEPYDAHSKMLMRQQLREMRADLEAMEALVAPTTAVEREQEKEENGLRLVG
jgi:calcineurin-like phosphoesterase family protein